MTFLVNPRLRNILEIFEVKTLDATNLSQLILHFSKNVRLSFDTRLKKLRNHMEVKIGDNSHLQYAPRASRVRGRPALQTGVLTTSPVSRKVFRIDRSLIPV